MNARHLLARSRGTPEGSGCECYVCGMSPFDPSTFELGDNFTDHNDCHGTGGIVCSGCASLLRGRPGDDPMPLRMTHILAVYGAEPVYPKRGDLDAILRAPPEGVFVLAIAESGKRHAALRAGVSTAARLLIGTDSACVVYEPARHHPLLDAVAALCIPAPKMPGFTRDQIRSGQYGASQIIAFGAARWEACERTIAPRRGTALLDLLILIARPAPLPAMEQDMIDPIDELAAQLLAEIAKASRVDKMTVNFWGGFLLHRLARFADLPLADFVSRLMAACAVPGIAGQEIVAALDSMSAEDVSGVSAALRARPALLVALAYERSRPAPKGAPPKKQESLW